MRRTLLVWCLLAVTLSAGKPQPLDLSLFTGWQQASSVIEKQSWWLDGVTLDPDHIVTNTTEQALGVRHTWDINENSEFISNTGSLASGASTSRVDHHVFDSYSIYSCRSGFCAWWSGVSNWVGLRVESSTPVVASMCFEPQGRCFTPTPVYNAAAHVFIANVCVQALYAPDDPVIVAIDGSGGGVGRPTTITRTVWNPSDRDVKAVRVLWGLASDVFSTYGCPEYPTSGWSIQTDYPWRWVML